MNNLKQMIKSKGTVWAAGAYDALSARLIQEAGFDALLTSGFGISSSFLGEHCRAERCHAIRAALS